MTVLLYVFLAFLNGAVIGTSRALNGRLSSAIGPFKASLWNHVVGFVFLSVALVVLGQWEWGASVPWAAYLGGFFGALFVAVNSYVFPRLGAMQAALLVISGQMIAAVLTDWQAGGESPTGLRCLGVAVVLLGIYLSQTRGRKEDRK
ncbi:DMT family transporter [Streptomyces triculaminicus]|uniref:DMT family transporter n=2 Tax=Streptomyces TaxID=1883 RepID=A0A939FP91_9ACTN|nr:MULTISPECIES: DMT family transporter [Streptomyces]MBO0654364.1 DMT family transporter [Streptomyces triculaminicus]QSY48997.1 DMT family transporter [Streptomyces griseocarneus]